MPGIHPSSSRQLRLMFALESRGQVPKGTARKQAHDWKCWTKKPGSPGCKASTKLLAKLRSQGYRVPNEVLTAEARGKKNRVGVVKVYPFSTRTRKPIPIAAYVAKGTDSRRK